MKQISLEEKVNNALKQLANQVASIQVYHWDEEFKKESLNDAWQKVQEQFKKDIDWNALTESQCKALHFGSWQSEEDIEEEISILQSEYEKGHLTKEEFDKKVADEKKYSWTSFNSAISLSFIANWHYFNVYWRRRDCV